jgi:EAL domain-containing protein (putative c-di-GMP-specific phosphodiesterase class I)/ActR/RegA family two-component response regulator
VTDFKDLSIFIIDDDPGIRDLLTSVLAGFGITNVETAENGREGLHLLDQMGPPDVILTDLDMPQMDGIEFLRHLGVRGVRSGIVLISGLESRLVNSVGGLVRSHDLRLLGMAPKPTSPQKLEQLLRDYSASEKSSGSRPMQQPITADELASGLKQGHLTLFFQPQVRVADGTVHGFEALARWNHPERGLLGPGTFIPLAESSKHIDALTECVIKLAIQANREWRDAGLDVHVSVNVSATNLRLNLPDYVAGLAAEHGIEASRVVVELTESQLMKHLKPSLEILNRVRLKGIGLSIDDFGTGYSSLEQLKRAPFTELKIDRSFVFGAASDPAARAILESSAILGKRLEMLIVAEGAETQDDWDLAAGFGCDMVQGYVVAKPMPGDEVVAWSKQPLKKSPAFAHMEKATGS